MENKTLIPIDVKKAVCEDTLMFTPFYYFQEEYNFYCSYSLNGKLQVDKFKKEGMDDFDQLNMHYIQMHNGKEFITQVYLSKDKKFGITVTSSRIHFYYNPTDRETVDRVLELCRKYNKVKTENLCRIELLVQGMNGPDTIHVPFKASEKVDLSKHYNDDFIEKCHDPFMKLIHEKENGLVFLHGAPGTGKTSYLKYVFMQNLGRDVIYIPAGECHMIGSSAFNKMLLGYESPILIVEDGEEILKSDRVSGGVSNLLNATSGMLGDIYNCLFVFTFNTDYKNIDNALKRAGRLKLKYEFTELSKEKAMKLGANSAATIGDIMQTKVEENISTMGFSMKKS